MLQSGSDALLGAGQAIIVTSRTALGDPSDEANWDAQMAALKVGRCVLREKGGVVWYILALMCACEGGEIRAELADLIAFFFSVVVVALSMV